MRPSQQLLCGASSSLIKARISYSNLLEALVSDWLNQATRARIQPNANAMVLATVDARGAPAARVVLCKQIRSDAGYITFFTNYQSRKGEELAGNPRAAAVMLWDALYRQVRIEGRVTFASAAESDAYFQSRPWQSRVGAWASRQSAPLPIRAGLEQAVESAAQRFHVPSPLAGDDAAPGPGLLDPAAPALGRLSSLGRCRGTMGSGGGPVCTIGLDGRVLSHRTATASRAARGARCGCNRERSGAAGDRGSVHRRRRTPAGAASESHGAARRIHRHSRP